VPPLSNVRVFRSPIHRYGLIATRDIEPDEVIAAVDGVLYRKDEIEDDTYCLWIDGEHFFDMVDQTRWINHSCDPNADVEADLDDEGGAWARVIALRPIRAGEEITYHYAFSQELAEPCRCGTDACCGWIVDPDELPMLLERLAREGREGREAVLPLLPPPPSQDGGVSSKSGPSTANGTKAVGPGDGSRGTPAKASRVSPPAKGANGANGANGAGVASNGRGSAPPASNGRPRSRSDAGLD
jgi:uncharacterized protein